MIASKPGQCVHELIPWAKGLVFPLPLPARDARPAASEQSGQERALSCCEGTRGLSPVLVEWYLASLLQGPLWEGRGLSARSFCADRHLKEMLLGFAIMEGEISIYYMAAWVFSLGGRWGLEQGRMLAGGVVPPQGIMMELAGVGGQGFALLVGSEVAGVPGGGGLVPFTTLFGNANFGLDL